MVVAVQVGAGVHGTRYAGGEGSILVLRERHVLAGSVRGVVGGVAVIGCHGVPEGAPLRGDTVHVSAWANRADRTLYGELLTYPEAIAADRVRPSKRVPRSSSDSSGGGYGVVW